MRKSNQTETNECKELILERLNSFSLMIIKSFNECGKEELLTLYPLG